MKLDFCAFLLFAGCAFAWPHFDKIALSKKSSDLIAWSSVSGSIESILDNDFAEYVNQEATSVSKTVTMSYFAKVLDTFFSEHPDCQDTFLIDYTTSNFYNHLISYTDGNIALTISTTIDNFDMETPEDFDDALETLDETLQEPVYDLLDVLDDLELQPAWEMTKKLRGFIHASENAGLTYKEAMMTATQDIVSWFEKNVDKCSADESTYGLINLAMEDGVESMSQEATQTQIDNIMASVLAQMDESDVELIEAYLVRAKVMRNLIWTKLKAAMAAGRTTTRTSAAKSIGAVLHTGGSKRKRHVKKSKTSDDAKLMRKLLKALRQL